MPNWHKLANHELVGTRMLFKDTLEFAHAIGAKPSRRADGNRSRIAVPMMAVLGGKAALL